MQNSQQNLTFPPKPQELSWMRWWRIFWNDMLEWPVVIALALAAFMSGYIGYSQYARMANLSVTWIDCAYHALQIFTLNFDVDTSQAALPWALKIAMVLAPGVTGYTLVQTLMEVFKKQKDMMQLARFKSHVVVCGLGAKGLQLVKEFRRQNYDVVVVEWDSSNPNVDACKELGAIIYPGDARDSLVLRRVKAARATRVIAVCGDDGTNIEISETLRRMVERTRAASDELICTVHIQDVNFWMLLRERELFTETKVPNFRLELFNVYDSGARILLDNVFQSMRDAERPHLLIIGLGDFGENLIVRAAQRWAFRARIYKRLPVSIVDPDVEHKINLLKRRYPLIDENCELRLYNFRTDWAEFRGEDFLKKIKRDTKTHVIVSLSDASMGLQAGFWLRNVLQGEAVQVLVRMQEDTGLANFLREVKSTGNSLAHIEAFGLLNRTCKVEMFDFNTREALARAIHEDYVEQAQRDGSMTNAASLSWDELSDELKESNRKQAEHISEKLKAVGCGIIPWKDAGAENFLFTKAEVETLARLEHERWVREKKAQGWRYAPKRNDTSKHHPDLLPWKDSLLSESAREKDRNAVYLLPRLLARAGFQIYRIPK